MSNTDDKSIFFLTLSFISIWVILDNIYGKKYLDTFLSNVFPFYEADAGNTIKDNSPDTDNNTSDNNTGIIKPSLPTINKETKSENNSGTPNDTNGVKKIFELFKKAGTRLAIMRGGVGALSEYDYGLADIIINPDEVKQKNEAHKNYIQDIIDKNKKGEITLQ